MSKRNRRARQQRREQTNENQRHRVERVPDPPERPPPSGGRVISETTVYIGPFPDPGSLQGFENVVSGSAREIIDMGKREQRHRHRCDFWEGVYGFFGMVCALAIGIAGLAAGVYLGINGQPWLGGTVVTVTLGTLATTFVLGRKSTSSPKEPATDKANSQSPA